MDCVLVVSPYIAGKICDNKSLQGVNNYNAAIIATVDEIDSQYLEENPPKIPVVLYNRDSEQFSSVTVDNDAAGGIAADQLLGKGIFSIGAVLQERPFVGMSKRRNSFIQACEEHGITGLHNHTVWSDGTVSGGFDAGLKIVGGGDIPKGIYCDSDSTALGLLSAFSKNNIRIPEDTEVVAIGTAPPALTQYSVQPLTVVELPLEEMAILSVNLLVDLLQRKVDAPQHVVLQPRLIVRE